MTERVFTQVHVAVGAILEKEGKILLVKEISSRPDIHNKWNQPAGWLDVGRDPIAMVVQEVKEETGLDFEPTGLVGIYSLVKEGLKNIYGHPPHGVKLIFRGKTAGTERQSSTEEISQVRWFAPEEIRNLDNTVLRDMDIKQEVEDYFSGKNYPLDIIQHTIQS